jgi:hypothetical protein
MYLACTIVGCYAGSDDWHEQTEKNGASQPNTRSILYKTLGVVTTDRSVSKKKKEAIGGAAVGGKTVEW